MQHGCGDYSASSYHPNYPPNPYPADLLTPAVAGAGGYASAPAPPPPSYADAPPQFAPSYAPAYSQYEPVPPPAGPAMDEMYYPPGNKRRFDQNYSQYEPVPPPPPPATDRRYNPAGYNPAGYNPSSDQGAGFYGGGGYSNPPPPAYEPPIPSYYDAIGGGGGGGGSGKFDQYGEYRDEGYGRYGLGGDAVDDGVYRYDGGRAEPYGARGTGSGGGLKSSSGAMFDDYGRAIGGSGAAKDSSYGCSAKIVKAVPKADSQQDVKSGVQKFRVKVLSEGWGQDTMDVLCQIGLDGIRMLDPGTSRMLRVYPLETVTRWEVNDPSIYTFWAKSSVDVEARRIRLQSNSYTTSTILDIVAASSVQLKEMGGQDSFRPKLDAAKSIEPPTEKKKGFADWMNRIKAANEEKDHWVPDEAVTKCTSCANDFGAFNRRHHCRNCGDIFCDKCTQGRIALTADADAQPVRVCDRCVAEVTHRLNIAKEQANRPAIVVTSHEDLAKKLQEEMDRNRKASSGSNTSDVSGRRMREVACPTCTVHLQVQVPASGSETIECGVCQHPFLVSAAH